MIVVFNILESQKELTDRAIGADVVEFYWEVKRRCRCPNKILG